jgi:hypothetical protein
MIVLNRTGKGYEQDPTKQFKFGRFSKRCSDYVLIEAAFEEVDQWEQFSLSSSELSDLKKKKIVRLEFEEPNKFFLGDNMEIYDNEFYRIFTLCPYTSEWLNKKHNNNRRVPIFFPFNEDDIPLIMRKEYDIIYTGHLVSKKLTDDIKIISKFNYRFVSNNNNPLVTNHKSSYSEKINLIAQSKITLVHNLLYPTATHIKNIWKYKGWRKNYAFKLIPRPTELWKLFSLKNIVVPQLKSRVFEAAFSRSLILCKHDQFNIIENYFEPGKEFVYYYEGELELKILEILENFGNYEQVIDNAYKRAINNYTTEKFVENYLKTI